MKNAHPNAPPEELIKQGVEAAQPATLPAEQAAQPAEQPASEAGEARVVKYPPKD
jgi:hypothetical protein